MILINFVRAILKMSRIMNGITQGVTSSGMTVDSESAIYLDMVVNKKHLLLNASCIHLAKTVS